MPTAKKKKFELPDWVSKEEWNAFVTMRRKIKKPMSDRSKQRAVNKLERLREEGNHPDLVLAQSEYYNWQDLYPVKRDFLETLSAAELEKYREKSTGIVDQSQPKYGDF